jgi:hypothetical protein
MSVTSFPVFQSCPLSSHWQAADSSRKHIVVGLVVLQESPCDQNRNIGNVNTVSELPEYKKPKENTYSSPQSQIGVRHVIGGKEVRIDS